MVKQKTIVKIIQFPAHALPRECGAYLAQSDRLI